MKQDMKKDMILQSIAKRLVRNGRTQVLPWTNSSALTYGLRAVLLLGMTLAGGSALAQVATTDVVVNGSVYGGGNLADVKGNTKVIILAQETGTGTDIWTSVEGTATIKGNVFGGGKGVADNFTCDKAMVGTADSDDLTKGNTSVIIGNGTVGTLDGDGNLVAQTGNVYGGGEVGRVEHDTDVKIGLAHGTSAPDIKGSVFGAGAGLETHGYSALVRGNSSVTIEGDAKVGKNVYGGGETATVGKYWVKGVDYPTTLNPPPAPPNLPVDMPYAWRSGGTCTVTIRGNAQIGPDGTSDVGHVFGACKGVVPNYVYNSGDRKYWSKRMVTYEPTRVNKPHSDSNKGTFWYPYPDEEHFDGHFVWEYFIDDADGSGASKYSTYLETLALATHPIVTIGGAVTIKGSVYGGGERGITRGSVDVNMLGGTVNKDIYGGGALADTNIDNWDAHADVYDKVTVAAGTSVVGYYTKDGNTYTAATGNAVDGTDYYSHRTGGWAENKTSTSNTTNVYLLGGTVDGDVYGGGLGEKNHVDSKTADNPAYVDGDVRVYLNGLMTTEDATLITAFNTPTAILSQVTGQVNDYYHVTTGGCVVKGNVFGCNNLCGTPRGKVKVHVFKTNGDGETHKRSTDKKGGSYELTAVYGGGNMAAYEPFDAFSTTTTVQALAYPEVIIDGCNNTSIYQVYGGGNAASTPATNVTVYGTYEIGDVFGGGNGADDVEIDGNANTENPGANVGFKEYGASWETYTLSYSTEEDRMNNYGYGSGKAQVNIYGGTIHAIYGGSNTKGNVREVAVAMLEETKTAATATAPSEAYCDLVVDEAYGGGKSAPMDGKAMLQLGCIPGIGQVYGGSKDADVNDDVVLTITNGTYGKVYGGNNVGHTVYGTITVNIQETGCTPIVIGELYGGGNNAEYSVENIPESKRVTTETADDYYKNYPKVNVISATRIGQVFGGGDKAGVTGNPHVKIDMVEGAHSAAIGNQIGSIGRVFGGGNNAGVTGDTYVDIKQARIVDQVTIPATSTTPASTLDPGVYGGCNTSGTITGNTYVNVTGGVIGVGSITTTTNTETNVTTTTYTRTTKGNVHGGGYGKETYVTGNVTVNIGTATTTTSTSYAGTAIIYGDVYGGGALGHVNAESVTTTDPQTNTTTTSISYKTDKTTTVNLNKGTIYGDAYGGGLGDASNAAYVGGDVNVYQNEVAYIIDHYTNDPNTTDDESTLVNSGRIFGCNNMKGYPMGNVTVTVNKTVAGNVSRTPDAKATNYGKVLLDNPSYHSTYEVAAVYGGGNLAPYKATGKKTHVIINGCDDTSIETVYGGGNAAAVPEAKVDVNAAWEIGCVFGGGNGKDKYWNGSQWVTNPGANIGKTVDGEVIGNGFTTTWIYGGTVHEAYGASNEKGTITGTVFIDVGTSTGGCTLDVGKVVGAGKNADVNGNIITILGCKPNELIPIYYGGADNANVNGNVELTITSGNFGQVFGGNNLGGAIRGHIIVNIEEITPCGTPITIDKLYLGGNQAAYSKYGYYVKTTTSEGPNATGVGANTETAILTTGDNPKLIFMPRSSATDPHLPVDTYWYDEAETDPTKKWKWTTTAINAFTPYDEPQLNVISCTSINEVFGGGYGVGGDMYANPTVNINMIKGTMYSGVTATTDNPNQLGVIGTVYGGGDAADVLGSTTVNIGTEPTVEIFKLKVDSNNNPILGEGGAYTWDTATESKDVLGAYISGNVYGGGKGQADSFTCSKAMIGKDGAGESEDYTDGNTNVNIGNGTVMGNVYGGGQIGRVERNTTVTIGLANAAQDASKPVIKGSVFGGGKGKETHGYAALVRGNPTVIIQADAKVEHSVYGGGEIASVARYKVAQDADEAAAHGVGVDMPYALANTTSGNCHVTVKDRAVIGPDNDTPMKMYHANASGVIPADDTPDDWGHVFGAGKGILPDNYTYADTLHKPKRMVIRDATVHTDAKRYTDWDYYDGETNNNIWEYFPNRDAYVTFIQTLALSSYANVTIGDESNSKPFVKGSVYGGSENGLVQFDTNVYIKSGQIGWGKYAQDNKLGAYGDDVWLDTYVPSDAIDLECPHWIYGKVEGTKTIYAPYDPNANASGDLDKYPPLPGQTVGKSTEGGRRIATDGHTYYGNVFGGGSGSVPYYDTSEGISKYLNTAGTVKGNTYVEITGGHILTNVYGGCEATNVLGKAMVKMTGGTLGVPRTENQIRNHPVTCYLFGAGKGDQRIFFNKDTNVNDADVEVDGGRIYGSVFGGGEDGHVMRHSLVTIKQSTGKTTKIGTTGNTYLDGNIFGGGRGFGGDALTAGNVGGCVEVNIEGGTILGSIYGGGRLASVGYGLYLTTGAEAAKYGKMREDNEYDDPNNPIDLTKTAQVFFAENPFTGKTFTSTGRGKITINIKDGTIGNDVTNGQYGGNVFGGSMGRLTKLDGTPNDIWNLLATAKSTTVNVTGGTIKRSVYGGGEMGTVTEDATVKVSGGTIGKADGGGVEFGNVYGGGKGYVDPAGTSYVQAGIIKGNTSVTIEASTTTTPTIYHNIYGGGAYGSVGTFTYDTNNVITGHTANTGSATVTITGGNIGRDGNENGMIFGSSRGDVGAPGSIHDKLAWVADAHVIIGKSGSGTDLTNPHIVGSVYGSGENGHVYNNTIVDIHSGTVGITSDSPITDNNGTPDDISDDITYTGAGYPYRGNVYGGGCGTDMYDSDDDGIDDSYNALAGIVRGTTTVNVTGGQVVRNIYGAGAMGSVGNMTTNTSTGAITFTSGGATAITISGGTVGVDGNENGNVFGAARGDKTTTRRDLALVKTTSVTISGNGEVKGSVYGGGEVGNVGSYTSTFDGTNIFTEGTGKCEVTMTGGKVDHNVFGAGKGVATTFTCEKAMAKETVVSVTGGTVTGNVYGGGEVGRVEHDTEVTIGGATIGNSVFGAGAGLATHGYSALVRGNTKVIVENNAQIGHSVYGGGQIASVGKYGLDEHKMPSILLGGGYCIVDVKGSAHVTGDVFGAGKGVETPFNSTNADRSKRSRRMTMYNADDFPEAAKISATTGTATGTSPNGTTWEYYNETQGLVWEYFQTKAAYDSYLTTLALATHPEVTISGNATIDEDVYGGGEMGLTKGSVIVNIDGGTIGRDVYGGGALAHTNTTSTVGNRDPNTAVTTTTTVHPFTKVNLRSGTVNGDVYGGGLGEAGTTANPDGIPAYVYGSVTVELNNNNNGGTVDGSLRGCAVNRIFGANNVNGSPKSHVLVHVFGTQNKNLGSIRNKIDVTAANVDDLSSYDVTSVFGGGNAADYVPADTCAKKYAEVIIEGCDLTSIHEVYGGGYGAAVPATDVLIKGTKIINNVFGGGYGAGTGNPGANIGFYTNSDNATDYPSATGKAIVQLMAGTINHVYGGSNTKGNIRGGSSVTSVERGAGAAGTGEACCDKLTILDIFGGGKSAEMFGGAEIVLGCMPNDWIGAIYGGAEAADVHSDVSLTLTSGKFERVFGGNKSSGVINGSIEVNIEENPNCDTPIIIGELYGGGNMAPYTTPAEYFTAEYPNYQSPRVNVRAFTSIGSIFGGGYGTNATVTGNPLVNINEVEGGRAYAGEEKTLEDGTKVTLYERKADGKMGVIGNVFGGGNAAPVIGQTFVNIGTAAKQKMLSLQTKDAGGNVIEVEKDVLGADIRGNVYGGGDEATVTGKTNVVIGQKKVE